MPEIDPTKARASAKLSTEEPSDLTLLQGVARGDRSAFQHLYERFYHPLLRFIYRITQRLDLAEEGVNDVMLVVWHKAGEFGGRSRVSTWIMGIAYRKALKLAEKSRRLATRFVQTETENHPGLLRASREQLNQDEQQDWLDQGLRQLSRVHRTVVELTYYHGYSYQEIADIMDCPVNTVKTRMFHARAKLQDILPPLAGHEVARHEDH